jgi:hypothetical protein
LIDSLKKRLKIYTNPNVIGYVEQKNSTWFNGYTEKYFFDKGSLFRAISNSASKILCAQYIIRHRKMFKKNIKITNALLIMFKGSNEFFSNR